MQGTEQTTNRNHSTYWIVNHWNPFKLVNIVSAIMEANLNWRIYLNYNPFKLVQLEVIHAISIFVHLWFEVLNWYWIMKLYRSSKSTIHYIRWFCIRLFLINNNRKYWMNLNEMIWIDLPSLQSITLGYGALRGRYDDESCSLTMRSNNEMIENDWM